MIEIIKNSMKEPITRTCEDCESVFTYNYEDVATESDKNFLGMSYYRRFVVCPVCKYRNTINKVKADVVEKENNRGMDNKQSDKT